MKLIVTDTNWADEMDIWGFETVSDKFYEIGVRVLTYYFESVSDEAIEIWVGTNEQVFFDKDFLREFKVTDITPQQEAQLLTMFGRSCCGEALFYRLVDIALDNMASVKDKMFDSFNKEFEEATRRA